MTLQSAKANPAPMKSSRAIGSGGESLLATLRGAPIADGASPFPFVAGLRFWPKRRVPSRACRVSRRPIRALFAKAVQPLLLMFRDFAFGCAYQMQRQWIRRPHLGQTLFGGDTTIHHPDAQYTRPSQFHFPQPHLNPIAHLRTSSTVSNTSIPHSAASSLSTGARASGTNR